MSNLPLLRDRKKTKDRNKITIEGYTGELFKDRFAVFLGKPIMTADKEIGRFVRKEAIYYGAQGTPLCW